MSAIGEIIFGVRGLEKVGQNRLCKGICSASTVSRLEWEGRNVSKWLMEAILQRLGKSQDSFWSIISISEYRIMELRRKIWDEILSGDYTQATEDVRDYEKKVTTNTNNGNLHMQYIWQCRGMIKGRRENDWKSAAEFLTKAIKYTMDAFQIENVGKLLLGRDEMQVILLLADAYEKIGEHENAKNLICGLVENTEKKVWDAEEKVKIYPKVILRCIEVLKQEDNYEEVIQYAQKAVNLLIDNGVIFLLADLMEGIMWAIKRRSVVEERRCSLQEEQEYHQLEVHAEVLKEVWEEFGTVSAEDMIYCTNVQKDISISNEIIVRCRKLYGLSQEQLSQDVCTVENLSRIENFKCSPMDKSYRGLMEKMNQVKDRNRYLVNAKGYSLHEKIRQLEKYINRMEYHKAAKEWKTLRGEISDETLNNQQCIARYDTIIKYYNKEIDAESAMKEYEEALKITMPEYPEVDIVNWPLSRVEIFLLQNIAEILILQEETEKAKEIYEKLCQFFESSVVDVLYRSVEYRLVLYNMANVLIEQREYAMAQEAIKKGIMCCITSGRCNMLPYFFYNRAEALVGEDLQKNRQKTQAILKRAFCLSNVFKIPSLSSFISDYYKNNWGEVLKY